MGRKEEIQKVVEAALIGKPTIITGAPGMGKSTVAMAAAYAPEIIAHFGSKRLFVNLEGKSDPLDLLLNLSTALGLKNDPTREASLGAIKYDCSQAPAFVILDNVEEIIDADNAQAKHITGLMRDIPGLSFVITSREPITGISGWEKLDDLPPLSLEESRDLFCGIATSVDRNEPALDALLKALDGHALSLSLLAGRVDGELSIGPMLERWQNEKADVLKKFGSIESRLNSVRASLRLSLSSRLITPTTNRLLAVLGFLPDGLPAGGLREFLGTKDRQLTKDKSNEATEILRQLRLIPSRQDGRLKVLNPLREALALEKPLLSGDRSRVLEAGFDILKISNFFGTRDWPEKEVKFLSYSGNIKTFISQLAKEKNIRDILEILEHIRLVTITDRNIDAADWITISNDFKSHDNELNTTCYFKIIHIAGEKYSYQGNETLAEKYYRCARDGYIKINADSAAAHADNDLGDLAMQRGQLDEAHDCFTRSKTTYKRIGSALGEANTDQVLGNLAIRRDQLDEAHDCYTRAKITYQRIGNALGEANTDYALGKLALRRDQLDEAHDCYTRAKKTYLRIGAALGEANTDHALGKLALRRDQLDEANDCYTRAKITYQRIGNALGEANTDQDLGKLALRRDQQDEAHDCYIRAKTTFQRIGDALAEATNDQALGGLAVRRDQLDEAHDCYTRAKITYQRVGNALGEANTDLELGGLAMRRDQLDEAHDCYIRAKTTFQRIGSALGGAYTDHSLGSLAMRRDQLDEAHDCYIRAKTTYQLITDALGEANVEFTLGELAMRRDQIDEAHIYLTQAQTIYQRINQKWGIANSSLKLAELEAYLGNTEPMKQAAELLMELETRDRKKLAAPGWRAFCTSLTEPDEQKRNALREDAQKAWTEIGSLGLIRDYLDFRIGMNSEEQPQTVSDES